MKLKRNKESSLFIYSLKYLTIFSLFILLFLWLFQILFLDKIYERTKVNDLKKTSTEIKKATEEGLLTKEVEPIAEDNSVCIQILVGSTITYNSRFNKGCNIDIKNYNISFDEDNTYRIINPKFNNMVLVEFTKLNDTTSVIMSVSLEPLDGAVKVLKEQFLKVIVLVLLISIILALYVSKRFAKPIEDLASTAKEVKKENYDVSFDVNSNIKEIKELSKVLNEAKTEIEKSSSLRKEIVANVSHDLKTPLTMIKAYAEMVRDLTYKNKIKRDENLNIIIEETDRLNLLVNDILDLSVLESNAQELDITDFGLKELIQDILRRYAYLKEYKFCFEMNSNVKVRADKKRIEQVIFNLLNNAVNYTGADKKVTIKVEDNISYARVLIIDTGKGIKKEDINLIWRKYYKADKTHKREKIGTGIGLSIVETILKKHKFKYGVESSRGEGTTFWFDIKKV